MHWKIKNIIEDLKQNLRKPCRKRMCFLKILCFLIMPCKIEITEITECHKKCKENQKLILFSEHIAL